MSGLNIHFRRGQFGGFANMVARIESLDVLENDGALVTSHLAGDPDAFAALYSRRYPQVVRFIYRRVRSMEIAEDLAQDAFAVALADLASLRNPDRFHGWVNGIARNLVRHHYREHDLSVTLTLDPSPVDEAADAEMMRLVDRQQMLVALNRISPRHQEILHLRDVERLTYEQMAERLGTPLTTIAPLLFRARASLRREYFMMTEREPIIVLPMVALAMLSRGWRRVRDALGRVTPYLPDASMFCTSVSCVVVGIGAVIVPSQGVALDEMPVSKFEAPPAVGSSEARYGWPPRRPAETRLDEVATPSTAEDFHLDVQTQVAGVYHQSDRARYGREYARTMPHYYEFGPVWFGADPDAMRRDLASSLEGDFDWMEGSCRNESGDC